MVFRIKTVDMDGYLGRDNHPDKSDVGLLVYPFKMVAVASLDWRNDEEINADLPKRSPAHMNVVRAEIRDEQGKWDYVYAAYDCLTEDGRVLCLMDHELELVRS